MPKRAPYLVRWVPEREAYDIRAGDDPAAHASAPDGDAWRAWLDGIASFSFHGRSGAYCTVRKETLRRGGVYWYAYRSLHGRTVKRYAGRSDDLSMARLEEIAGLIAGASRESVSVIPPPPPSRDALSPADEDTNHPPLPAPVAPGPLQRFV